MVSDDDVSNYNKIKTDLDKLRLLVEQSELWVYKKKESANKDGDQKSKSADSNDKAASKTAKASVQRKRSQDIAGGSQVGDQFVLQELEDGPELSEASVLKYKELYKILYSMVQLCVTESTLPNGQLKKQPRRNDQRLLRNMGVHNIVLDLTKISYEKSEDKRMRIIMRTAHQFLQNFCFANPHNQVGRLVVAICLQTCVKVLLFKCTLLSFFK